MAQEEISLEETNKIRISLGLKPLTDDKAPASEDKEKQAEDNYARQREQETKARESKKVQDQIAKVRNRRELHASLKGSTLGDADGDDDTMKWIKRSKKKEKELAQKRAQELENMDKVFQGEEYSERDLVGLKVSHDFDNMDDGEQHILTLKDSRILDNEEDELQNVELAEQEANKKRLELKSAKRAYTGYDDDEFAEGKHGAKRSVLAKYDEDIEGPSETGFRLGSSAPPTKAAKQAEQVAAAASVNKSLLSIDYVKDLDVGDYLKEGDKGFKKFKVKKGKKRAGRARTDAELADGDDMAVDAPAPIERNLDMNFVDDDELQAALARERRAKLRKSNKLTPEELAKKVAAQKEAEENAIINLVDGEPTEDGGLTFDDTSEFIRAVGNNAPVVKKEPKETLPEASTSKSRDVSMAPADEALNEMQVDQTAVKTEEDEDYSMEMLDDIERVLRDAEEEAKANAAAEVDDVGTSAEQSHRTGMAATLNILRQQGVLSAPANDGKEREAIQKQRDAWLADQRLRVARRELEKATSRGGNRDQATREYENRMREQAEARENLESFKNYKPDVNIVYYDEHGRALTPKEAWKALSHKFHGKGSGKMKTEKRLKKIAEEKKKEAMISGDTPLSMNAAFMQRQEKAGQAHFVLSVGNKGAVPQMAEFLDTQPLSKGKTEKAKNKKAKKNGGTTGAGDEVLTALPASALTPLSGSPAPRAGFSRVGSTMEAASTSRDGTPGASERTKVAFGFGTKRKVDDDGLGSGSPSQKVRR
ncbi:SART-1 protein [Cylindrobasidium torrendii FP15055 ss-10]|uniref:SART-1 protein n=1 Tax=Cylindrobasidium torrendii FP15055 ss-10 TaxID=1314674 RepID=A0A0D7BMS5_9AGAR|nr:SART-1 protein [Cylindrobasidium torrendii FP15055 ss-10]